MQIQGMRVLVTGAAGFIGYHTCARLLAEGAVVQGIDNFSTYYDIELKEGRAALLGEHADFALARVDIADQPALAQVWTEFRPEIVIHLAAQAGVRYSIDHPEAYIGSNLIGMFNILELARHHPVRHLLAASTSSVYGTSPDRPYQETARIAWPLTLYAATKGANELMGHSYSHLFGIPTTFFRFFTVYGPWGRPDMAPMKFAHAIAEGRPIDVYNHGEMVRDFTYVADLVEAVLRLTAVVPGTEPVEGDSLSPIAPCRIVNIGGGEPVRLTDFIAALEAALGREALRNYLPMQPGDVPATEASAELLERLTGYVPATRIEEGVPAFVDWFRQHYSSGA